MPRILLYDTEVSPTLGWTYGLYDTRVIRTEHQPFIMSYSYRWYGEKTTHFERVNIENMRPTNEEEFITKLRDLFDEADILIAHNANRFDNKIANASFIRLGLSPPSPSRTVDTLQVARRVAKYNSNSLNALGEVLGVGQKTTVTHADLWYQCLNNDERAWRSMKKYNNQDVAVLYGIYEKLLPYMNNHPNVAVIDGEECACPNCGSKDYQRRGFRYTNASKYQRVQCNNCSHWFSMRTVEEATRTLSTNYT